jgi:hypothetical protein
MPIALPAYWELDRLLWLIFSLGSSAQYKTFTAEINTKNSLVLEVAMAESSCGRNCSEKIQTSIRNRHSDN